MKYLDNLTKDSGNGKIAAIVGITSPMSFRTNGIKNIGVKLYRDYLMKYVGYKEVYIISTSIKEQKVKEEYFDKDICVFGIDRVNLFNDLNIDDIFCRQHALIFFGGVLNDYYFSICNRLYEWYCKHGDGHYYTIQDDPDFITINPLKFCENRINKPEDSKPKPYKYNHDTKDAKLYLEYQKNNNWYDCYDNTIVAYCGNDYELFYNRRINIKFGSPNYVTEPKYWCKFNTYNWQAVNCNLEDKFKDYPLNRKYQAEYHGYIKHDDYRVKHTLAFYNALEGPNKIIEAKGHFSDNFNNAEKFSEVPYNELFKSICDAYASFIIANPATFDDFISPRYFDLMLSDIIPFVFTPYDSKKQYTDDEFLKEFMYVDTPEQFKERVERLIKEDKLFCKVKYHQRKSIYDKFNNYMLDESKKIFEKYLEENKKYY